VAEFTAIFGFAFAFPFLPLFLRRDLGIQTDQALAFWSGIVAGASGFSMAIASPIWGMLADRFGRKPMLIRAMLGGGVSVGLMGLAQSALQLTGLRLVQGAASGTVASATALVAAETPRTHVAWALGILSSSVALGSAVGPTVGGLASGRLGLRTVFVGGGVLLLLSSLPVMLVVRESSQRRTRARATNTLEALRARGPGTLRALGVLISAQALMQASFSACQQLIILRILQLAPGTASTVTGIAFGAAGIATAVASVTYARALRRSGFRRLTAIAAFLLAVVTAGVAVPTSIVAVVAIFVLASFLFGALTPALASMIGLEAPSEVAASIFGVSASAFAIGFGVGPLLAGLTASAAGVPAGLLLAAAMALVLSVLLAAGSREPLAPGPGTDVPAGG
jgi:MFS transporter, DHA1 family, multidrug resistance protein